MSQPPSRGSDGAVRGEPRSDRPAGVVGGGQKRRLAVLGVGQLGGSLALAGRAAGLFDEVVGFGRRAESLDRARSLGLCDVTTASAAEAVAGADVVVLATPLRAIPSVVDMIASGLQPGALVIDVGSVKGTAVRDIEARLGTAVDFVPCHPLAGTEHFGPDAARVDLFTGQRCLICPTGRTSAAAIERARSLWQAVGALVVIMQADLHDRVMAAVSHLPHVAAYALTAAIGALPSDVERAARTLPTTSLRDTSRVAASSPAMWTDIFLENRDALLPLIESLATELERMKLAIATGDDAGLRSLLDAARENRARILPR